MMRTSSCILWVFGYLVVSLHSFSHSGFGVERFMRINDENAITYPSTNVNHCIGLFLTFCKTRPNCIGFSVSKSNRLCKLSDYAEGWSLADDDAYDAYPKISDNVLNSPEGGGGNILIATPLMTPESRTTTTTSPRSRSWNYCPDSYPYSFASGSQCCTTKRDGDNAIMSRGSSTCRNGHQQACSTCYSKAINWNKILDETYVVPYS